MQQRKYTKWKRGNRIEETPTGLFVMRVKDGFRWYARFQIAGKREDGPIRLADGRYLVATETVSNWRDAETWLMQRRADMRSGKVEEAQLVVDSTVNAVLCRVEDEKERQDSPHPADVSTLAGRIERLAEFFGANRDVTTLTSDDLAAYVDWRCKQPTKRKGNVKRGTACREVRLLKQGMTSAGLSTTQVRWPKAGVAAKVEGQSAKPRTRDVVDRFLSELQRHSWVHDLCQFVLQTGLRREEIWRLRRDWLDLTTAVPRLRIKPKMKRPTKTYILLTPLAVQILQRAMAAPAPLSRSGKTRDPALIWGSREPSKLMAQACQRAGIAPIISMRDLRATYGRRVHDAPADKGGGIYGAMRALRHSNVETTTRYLDLQGDELGRAFILEHIAQYGQTGDKT